MTEEFFSFLSTPNGLMLQSNAPDLGNKFFLDYEKGSLGYRLTPKRVLHEPLAKIIDKQAWVFDATGGILKDAIIMAFLGCKVWTCEAHPLIARLAQDGLMRASNSPLWATVLADERRFKFFMLDSRLLLEDFLRSEKHLRPDIVYLDPMFPAKKKSSIAKKEITWLQRIHAATKTMYPDYQVSPAELIFELASRVAQKRLIVKRPIHAPNLVNAPPPSFTKRFQSSRFDVYLPTG